MTIRHFRIFIAVANTESITRAAQALYVSQPTVSVAIRELEQHYGTRLFERISQRLKITEAGRALLGYATHLISLYDEMEATFQNPDSHGLLRGRQRHFRRVRHARPGGRFPRPLPAHRPGGDGGHHR